MTARGTNLPRVKKQNEALIKEIIYKYGPISRSKIAEMLSLTPPTITTNVSSLIERGLVYEFAAEDSDVEERSLGRKPIKINFIQDARYAVGVEMNPSILFEYVDMDNIAKYLVTKYPSQFSVCKEVIPTKKQEAEFEARAEAIPEDGEDTRSRHGPAGVRGIQGGNFKRKL